MDFLKLAGIITTITLPLSAQESPNPEQTNATVEALAKKAFQHQGRILSYEGTNSSKPGDIFQYSIYQDGANTWEMIDLKLLSQQKLIHHMTLFAGKREAEDKLSISFIDHQSKTWAELRDIERINSQITTLISAAGDLLLDKSHKIKEQPLTTRVYAGIRNGNITYGAGFTNNISNHPYWKYLLGEDRMVSNIEDNQGKTTFAIKEPSSSFVINNKSGLLELSTETIDDVTRTTKLVKVESTLPPLAELLPEQKGYKQIAMDTNSPMIRQMVAQAQAYSLLELGKRPDVQEQLLNKQDEIKAKLRKKYFDMIDFNEIDQAILADLPDIKPTIRKALGDPSKERQGQELLDILEYFSSNDKKRLEAAEAIIAKSIQDKEILGQWNTSLLGICLNIDPDNGEGMFLIASTMRDALLSAYWELETYKAMDTWVADQKAKMIAAEADAKSGDNDKLNLSPFKADE